ncbi:hypothetical protein K1T71_009758 [Dendrolimus kikuchii]|uniref:Uncharacterized protein n=1 Tax=Dendrolimus kikuchii TaxID=765133 RepID=A0ACC1CT92_9NEOP|nr:hypothetical protein K1T71_009758 [Dendrolimus kikuchii]
MDKNTFETCEYLPLNNGENVPDQFFVVQDDGTLLNQLISSEGESNLYNGTFILQPGSSSPPPQIEEPVVNQVKDESQDLNIVTVTSNSKQTSVFTEITLSDEQYRLLEQKGWILLEYNDKIFVLNTLGLHDITDNDQLIQKLRNEIQNHTNNEPSSSGSKIEVEPSSITTILDDSPIEANTNLVDESVPETTEHVEEMCLDIDKEDQEVEDQIEINDTTVAEIGSDNNKKDAKGGKVKSLKIKTKLSFKDIPDKIFLGTTRKGKNLYAKVKHCSKPLVIYEINADNQVDQLVFDPDMNRGQFLSLVYNLNRKFIDKKQHEENVVAAKSAVAEISKIHDFKHYIIGQYLFITRITHKTDDINNKRYKSKPTLLTAVVEANSNGYWELIPNPNLLDDILKGIIPEDFANNEYWKTNVSHIHIKEMKSTNNIVRVYITLGEQELCFLSLDEKPRRRSPLHACSTCAKVFSSKQEIELHQESQCLGTDDPLAIDKKETNEPYTKIINGDEEFYCCSQCDAKFMKLSTCEKHLQTHYFPKIQQKTDGGSSKSSQQSNSDTEQSDANKKHKNPVYKCTMCPGTYFHSSTYSKHLMSQHIKLELN